MCNEVQIDYSENIGSIILKGREAIGLSQYELSSLARVKEKHLQLIETGKKNPNPKFLKRISDYININYNDLMYAAGFGLHISPLNPFLKHYFSNLKDEELLIMIDNVETTIIDNSLIILTLKQSLNENEHIFSAQNALLDKIEELEYQNITNREIIKLLRSNNVKKKGFFSGLFY